MQTSELNTFPKEKIQVQGGRVHLPRDHSSEDASPIWLRKNNKEGISPNKDGYSITSSEAGQNTIYSGRNAVTVHTLSPATMKLFRLFKDASRGFAGIRLKLKDGSVIVEGKFYQFSEWQNLVEIAEKTAGKWKNLASSSTAIEEQIRTEISNFQKQNNLLPVLPRKGGGAVEFSRPELVKTYTEVLQPFGIAVVQNLDSVNLAPMVKVQITVAEVKKSFSRGLGLDWPQQIRATVLPGSGPQYDSLVFGAKAFESRGEGKVLASPTLLTRSGKDAEFLAGGELPIKIMNYKLQDVIWKQYGIRLKIKPLVDNAGRMSIGIETEVSTIDEAHAVDGIPGMLTNRMNTHLDLQRSKVIALSGLLKSEQGRNQTGLAGLSRIPILGGLFSSEDFRENKSELIIFVRPSVVDEFLEQEGA